MLFMYIHTHPVEKCLVDQPQEAAKLLSGIAEKARKANIKMTGYAAWHEHTFYAVIEANDILELENILAPMTKWGDANLIPVIPVRPG